MPLFALTPEDAGQFADGAVMLIAGVILLMIGYGRLGPSSKPGFNANEWRAKNGRKFLMLGWIVIACGGGLTLMHLPALLR